MPVCTLNGLCAPGLPDVHALAAPARARLHALAAPARFLALDSVPFECSDWHRPYAHLWLITEHARHFSPRCVPAHAPATPTSSHPCRPISPGPPAHSEALLARRLRRGLVSTCAGCLAGSILADSHSVRQCRLAARPLSAAPRQSPCHPPNAGIRHVWLPPVP
jgi:hypothetical protein